MPYATTPAITFAATCLAVAVLIGAGCQPPQPARAPSTFDELYDERDLWRDSVLTLTGQFLGWAGGSCAFPSYAARQETRSDWILKVGESCLYVTGGMPPGFSAMDDSSAGREITLQAKVRVSSDGKIILEYTGQPPVPK